MVSDRSDAIRFRRVLDPLAIGPVQVRNRVVRTGHGTGMGGGTISAALVDYHVERARGGVGLTILEAMAVGSSAYPFLVAGAPGVVEGYRALMERVRPHGMRVFQQLGHLGNEIPERDGSPPWSSSDTVGALVGIQSQPMTHAQIDWLVERFAIAARDCEAGGLDGIELHMAHGYLVQQFLSPLFNRREDEYGGDFENRIRLTLRLLGAVRAEVSPRLAVGVRLSPELMPGGFGPDDVARLVRMLCEHRLVDYVNLTLGTDYDFHKIIAAMHEPTGYELPYAAPVKAASAVPVLVTGRFRTLQEADEVIASGRADLVALTRAHIADPDIVRKTLAGDVEGVRPCIACNHGCIGGLMTVGRIGCAVNVAVGSEATLSERLISRSARALRVLVVGGGPAGLEAARVAAMRGHRVVLAEATGRLGGSLNVAARAPRRGTIADIVRWQEREIARLDVEVQYGSYIEPDDVRRISPDAVIVATGSSPRLDGRQHLAPGLVAAGMEQPHVVSSHDVLLGDGRADWGRSAVVLDDTGHYEAVAVAEYLLSRGLSVTFVTGHSRFAPGLEPSLSAAPALERLGAGSFRLVTYGRLLSVGLRTARVGLHYGGEWEVPADAVVFVSHNRCNRQLLDGLGEAGIPVLPVGDVVSPRYLQVAIREGHFAGRGLA